MRLSDEFSGGLMDATPDCVKVLDLDGRVLHMNIPGLRAMEIDDFRPLCGQEWQGLWPADARGDIERSVARAAGGEGSSFQAYCPTAKGTPKWWEVTVSPVRDAEGGPVVRLLSVSRDVTERKQAADHLRESAERYRAAIAVISDVIWTNSADGLMEGEQCGWSDFTGQSHKEYQGQGWLQAIHPDDVKTTLEAWSHAVQQKSLFIFEHRVRRRDGQWRLCSIRAVPLWGDGAVREWVGVHIDITERKRGEEKLRQFAADLSEADHRKDEFLATLAHELRNPLAPIRNGLQLMKLADGRRAGGARSASAGAQLDRRQWRDRRGQQATIEKARSMMERQLTQMVRLVDDLMDASRINLGKLELRKERLPLASVVNSAVEASRPLMGQMGHKLTVTLPEQPIIVDADMTRLAQVFLNLLNNAAKYSDRGGHIRLNVESQGSEVVVTVKDNGIGIDADKLPQVFEMFTQLGGTFERSQGGLGIGLTLVKRLVDMHGGSVEAKSDGPALGSEFVVRLPVVLEASQPQASRVADGPTATKPSLRILIVDDNRDGADSLSEMLKMMGNDTRTAYDGQQGVDLAGEYRPDVILLDIGLPKLNGYEACRLIREQLNGKRVVLIAMTGWGQDEDRRRSREAGFDHHMVKPLNPQSLVRMLSELVVGRE